MEIDLGKGRVPIIDDEDAELVVGFKWYAMKAPQAEVKYYAAGWKHMPPGRYFVHLHRLIANAQLDEIIDHIDRDTLNCRKSNLRRVTRQQNIWNRGPCRRGAGGTRTSQYKGVYFCRTRKLFGSRIVQNGKRIHLGWFTSDVEAARVYNAKAKELYGDFAYLNPLPEAEVDMGEI